MFRERFYPRCTLLYRKEVSCLRPTVRQHPVHNHSSNITGDEHARPLQDQVHVRSHLPGHARGHPCPRLLQPAGAAPRLYYYYELQHAEDLLLDW